MISLSGANRSTTSRIDFSKSPARLQQMHPEFISRTSTPAPPSRAPSIPISPNSFSMIAIFSPARLSASSLRISVVFPAPRNPEMMSTLVGMARFR